MIFVEGLTYEDYSQLRASAGWKNFSREQTERALTRSAFGLSVKDGEQTVAMGRAIGDGLYYSLVDIVVRPDYQGQGVGTRVIHWLLDRIEQEMPENSRVSVQLLAEKGKEGFYEKLGFRRLPHEFCGSALRKVLYK